ncbi:hypothetical protein TSAR_008374 [Trichomalopsis sarcophagae]|uniref:Endonuclease/exonuclease/phosphatase domain-containing protein n=1 Tax=Trichomalopsis sarcophagae TaxID=543379 RepID=A0A232EFZ1_9HYME|nr:hypothetical protein TSAR_008374 [Trichomalopsis sarcophagae]
MTAGVYNKDRNFWEYTERADFISLGETWIEEKDGKNLMDNQSNKFICKLITAKREHVKGRAKGGFLIEVKKSIYNDEAKLGTEMEEGLIKSELCLNGEKLTIWSVYNSGKSEDLWEKMNVDDIMEEGIMIIGGDFNIRIGEKGTYWGQEEGEDFSKRASKDKCISNGGRQMVEFVENKGWIILNGFSDGDAEGEFTFIGTRGSTVIDYVIVNEKVWDRGIDFRVECRVDSDHAPVCALLEAKESLNRVVIKDNVGTKSVEERDIMSWTTEIINIVEKEEDSVELRWKDTKAIINSSVKWKTMKNYKWRLGTER